MFDYLASSIAFAHVSLEEACARVAALGLKRIDLWFVSGMCEHLPPNATRLDLPRIRKALKDSGLACHALSVYGASHEVTLARLEQLAELGGKVLVRDSQTGAKDAPQDVVERLLPFLKHAEQLGVVYAPENHWATAFDSIAQMLYVIEALPSKHLGVAYGPSTRTRERNIRRMPFMRWARVSRFTMPGIGALRRQDIGRTPPISCPARACWISPPCSAR